MQIGIERREPWTLLHLSGDLDAEAGPLVYMEFRRALLQGETRFLFNLQGVQLVDSAGLGVLVRCYRDARSRGGEIRLQDVPREIVTILEFTRLDALFRLETAIGPGRFQERAA